MCLEQVEGRQAARGGVWKAQDVAIEHAIEVEEKKWSRPRGLRPRRQEPAAQAVDLVGGEVAGGQGGSGPVRALERGARAGSPGGGVGTAQSAPPASVHSGRG